MGFFHNPHGRLKLSHGLPCGFDEVAGKQDHRTGFWKPSLALGAKEIVGGNRDGATPTNLTSWASPRIATGWLGRSSLK
jgi:hypothetical protein